MGIKAMVLCLGCDKPIKDGEKDIVIVEIGTAEFDMGNLMLSDWKQPWYGHKKCFYEKFKA